jgi:hypothetical protein
MKFDFKSENQIIGEWLQREIVRLLSEAELPVSVQDQLSQKITTDRFYELAEEFVDRFDDYDIITDKFPDEDDIYEEKFRENFKMDEQCYEEFGHPLEFVEEAVDHYEDHLSNLKTDDELIVPVEGDHWIEFPKNTGANAMMKKIRDVNSGSIWMNLKREIVYVSFMEMLFAHQDAN